MATDSTRKDALQNMVTALQAINGAGVYFTDVSGTGQVSLIQRAKAALFGSADAVWINVRDGLEEFEPISATQRQYRARLQLLIDIVIVDASTDTLVEELNDVIHDVHLAIGADPTLSDAVCDTRPLLVNEPDYENNENMATVTMVYEAEYDFVAGTDI